jgi:hypothetical protein
VQFHGHPHGVNPLGGAYFWLAAVDWRVQTPLTFCSLSAGNNAPTVAGTKEIMGNEPVAGLLLFIQTPLSENQILPAAKSTAMPHTSPGAANKPVP